MFLTRIGFGSKVVITGDITQVDLPRDKKSGLEDAIKTLDGISDIAICRLTSKDVVRHPLVQKIIRAYEKNEDFNKKIENLKDNREEKSKFNTSSPKNRARMRK